MCVTGKPDGWSKMREVRSCKSEIVPSERVTGRYLFLGSPRPQQYDAHLSQLFLVTNTLAVDDGGVVGAVDVFFSCNLIKPQMGPFLFSERTGAAVDMRYLAVINIILRSRKYYYCSCRWAFKNVYMYST